MMTAETCGKTCPSNVEMGGDWSCETLEEFPGVEIDSPVEGDSSKRKDKVWGRDSIHCYLPACI
jgi:hypothetical protein